MHEKTEKMEKKEKQRFYCIVGLKLLIQARHFYEFSLKVTV